MFLHCVLQVIKFLFMCASTCTITDVQQVNVAQHSLAFQRWHLIQSATNILNPYIIFCCLKPFC